ERRARLRREYEILRGIDDGCVVKALGLERLGEHEALVLEDFGGAPLSRLMRSRALSLRERVSIGVALARALEGLHRHNIIHKDVKPQNVLVHPETGVVKLIDFGIATRLTQEHSGALSVNALEGTLAYISPEQTGRVNRVVDHRSDLYSLGATLYELFSGILPFASLDALELVHSHIARRPVPPHERDSKIPLALSNIVMKLLAKAAEERYQSARGVAADLARVYNELEAGGALEPFKLATEDRLDVLRFPQRLYGREREFSELVHAFSRSRAGETQLVLIRGYSGVGKTALVQELRGVVSGHRGQLVSGKFDQRGLGSAYEPVASALRELLRRLLGEPEETLRRWRSALTAAVGANGQVIADIVPELTLLLGRQQEVPSLGPVETQNRFTLVFQNFLRVFATAAHPLVLFIDDLQWSDPASRKLLQLVLKGPDSGHLLVIGAYRDNEVEPGHPLRAWIDAARRSGAPVVELELSALGRGEVERLLADTFAREPKDITSLTSLVHEKTGGNPFFTRQFLQTLYEDGALWFDAAKGRWTWDVGRAREAVVTDNVVDFMLGKLGRLREETRRVLRLAACVGGRFDQRTLTTVAGLAPTRVSAALWEALREGLVVPLDPEYRLHEASGGAEALGLSVSYRFLHDRVQQTAYSTMDAEQRERAHLRIGRLLLSSAEDDAARGHALEHLNLSAAAIEDPAERRALAEMNHHAGLRAKAATAYEPAADLLAAGIRLLAGGGWQEAPALAFSLHIERVECEFLSGRFDVAESLFGELLERTRSPIERAQVHNLRIVLYSTLGKFADAVAAGREGLALFAIELTDDPAVLAVEFGEVERQLEGREIRSLVELPEMEDPAAEAVLRLLMHLAPPTFFVAPSLFPIVASKPVNISLACGNSSISAYGYMMYAMVLAAMVGDYERAHAFGTLALDITERRGSAELAGMLPVTFAAHVNLFRKPLRTGFPLFERSYQTCLENGDFLYLSFACFHSVLHRLGVGDELDELRLDIDRYLVLMERTKDLQSTAILTLARHMIASLQGSAETLSTLGDGSFDGEAFYRELEASGLVLVQFLYHVTALKLALLAGELDAALARVDAAAPLLGSAEGTLYGTEFSFYAAFAALVAASPGEPTPRAELIDHHAARLREWARSCPENFRHQHLAIEAERARLRGDELAAMSRYDEAIDAAARQAYPHHEALLCERAAAYYHARGRARVARAYASDAHGGYARWGALAKVEALASLYPHLVRERVKPGVSTTTTTSTNTQTGWIGALDVNAVIRASQAIASELRIERLLPRLMRLVIENAGAARGYLLLADDGALTIEASASADEEHGRLLPSVPLIGDHARGLLSPAVAHYVARTRESLVLGNAGVEGAFASDASLRRLKTRSLMCAPLLDKGQLIGIIYLVNDMVVDAFTPQRAEVVTLMASQAAISLANARLLEEARASNKALEARTHELEEARDAAEAANRAKSVFLATMSHELRT
ncbi:MAG: AAA family ATPase, partial [Myxococcales bacterium]|nr:AAA family ATPase [Myxococcales bacterium]